MRRARRARVVLGVTGSIAAYKAAEVTRYFMKRGCAVRVVMTHSAEKFISPLTFESITGEPVLSSFWDETRPGAIGHIELADWADVLVVAPASADFIAKASHGFAESPVLAVMLATKAPIVLAPAMNVNMFSNPATQDNIARLTSRGVQFVEPESGLLACGWRGKGRLARKEDIYFEAARATSSKDLKGKRILITAGPTREAIDPVRYISNRSSGKMGVALAREAYLRGAEVTLVHGPLSTRPVMPSAIKTVPVTSALEMRDAVFGRILGKNEQSNPDIIIMAAAVADYRPIHVSTQKIKKTQAPPAIGVASNPDILEELGRLRGQSLKPILVGFAVETGTTTDLVREASRKCESKQVDLVVGNLAEDSFDKDTNRVVLVSRQGDVIELPTASKRGIAKRILDYLSTRGGHEEALRH